MEEDCENTDNIYEDAIVNPEVIPRKQVELNEEIEEPVDTEYISE